MNVQQTMEDVQQQQHVQIQLEAVFVLVNLVILEMVSLVLVLKFYTSKFASPKKKKDVDECSGQGGGNNCALGTAICTNTIGSFTCKCNTGYSGNGVSCAGNEFLVFFFS